MTLFLIKHRFSGTVLFERDCGSLKLCVEAAVKARAYLAGANLAGANLAGANLAGANLADANLARANLAGANLADANLARAYLAGANLAGANLARAYLAGANLARAYLAGANLADANLAGANLARAYLAGANLAGANLADANLAGANLAGANLADANLAGAYLADANLACAYLAGAYLAGAKGIAPERCTDLLMLLDQPGKIRAYKLVNAKGEGPYNGGIIYEVGERYSVHNANTDPTRQCAAGINLATLPWCLHAYSDGHRVLIAEFTAEDIAAIPTGTDGKFRVHRCKIVGEKDISALVAKPEKEQAA